MTALPKRVPRQQMRDALENAARERTEREARGEHEPLEDWPDGPPPQEDIGATERYLAAFRAWHEKHIGPVSDAEYKRVRADHGLT
jgi:hypothetical protein